MSADSTDSSDKREKLILLRDPLVAGLDNGVATTEVDTCSLVDKWKYNVNYVQDI